MIRLLSILTLVLSIVLFPPASLAVISNNAVPGDATYPIKRSLESVIVAVASFNPTTKAWFSQTRSNRRYKEFTTLAAQGKKTTEALNELVQQTDVAVLEITQVKNESEKSKLIEQLSQSIEKYDQGLEEISTSDFIAQVPQPATQTAPQQTTSQTQVTLKPRPAEITTTKSPTTKLPTPTPSAKVSPTPSPTPTPTSVATEAQVTEVEVIKTPNPTVRPTPHPDIEEKRKQRQKEIEEARKRLEETKKKLTEERRKLEEERRQQREEQRRTNSARREKEEERLTPSPQVDTIEEEKQ